MGKQISIGRSEEEIAELLTGYEQSGLTRRDYCQERGVAVTTFDYYRRSRSKRERPALVPVRVEPAARPSLLTLVCANGRRIEVPSHFSEDGLLRLLRVAERA
jgi:hypothetical protein